MGRKSVAKPKPGPIDHLVEKCKRKDLFYNAADCYDKFQRGHIPSWAVRHSAEYVVSDRLKYYDVITSCSCLTRRVTMIAWHPTIHGFLFIGSKGGEFVACNPTGMVRVHQRHILDQGIGPGGSVLSIAFDLTTPSRCYTASLDGTVKVWDFEKGDPKVLLNTGLLDRWFCSVSTSQTTGLVVAGDTSGVLTVLSGRDRAVLSEHKLHKSKINMTEMCNSTGLLLITSSMDKTVKVWDIRKLTERSPLETLIHDRPINSAYLSPSGSGRLLTTDQHSQLRVYRTGDWGLETVIIHPHRQFQHMTAIKATWHPLCDLIVVGRYPDPSMPDYVKDELRTVDVFSSKTGKLTAQLSSPSYKGIMTLNAFDPTGEYLASGMGLSVPVWAYRNSLHVNRNQKPPKDGASNNWRDDDDNDDDDTFTGPPSKKVKKKEKKKMSKKK